MSSQDRPDTRARDALILGQPPRIAPLKPDELGKEASETALALRKAATGVTSSEVTEFTATALKHPALYRRHVELAMQLYQGAIAPRDRELAILRVGWLSQAPYEWGQHVPIGKKAGLTPEEIERVTQGSDAPGWNEHDRTILRAVEELIRGAMITDATWTGLSRILDEPQLIEFPILIGQYLGIAYLQNSLRMRLIAGHEGLSAR
ncbi:MAG TPA: carboxymuconolactone decarboxylase family protein [Steroidobacteraceae bacterium]|jgi:alkylhydroperoxidase family enzyme|nr:carboxymuconolactone decarboxylase family protein [Steroidobacteraceae bacterium]